MIDRYSRQTIFSGIGEQGQRLLGSSSVAIIGCGALGTVIATALVRAGVGRVRIIDRDFVEYHNLQRQVLFDEDDIRNELPKAIAAERHLRKVNSSIEIEGIVADVNWTNAERLMVGSDVVLDGLDNFESRFLINDVAVKHGIPWVYGGAVSSLGMTMTIIPGQTPCFRCVSGGPRPGGATLTCDTGGVIGPAPFVVGSLQSVEAMKILVGSSNVNRDLISLNVWEGTLDHLKISRRPGCLACEGKYEFLEGQLGVKTTSLCGQNAVQVTSPNVGHISLGDLAARLKPVASEVRWNEFMLHFSADTHDMVVFPDGRAILRGSTDESLARGLYAKYVGV